jgi:hypothetical protein
MPRVAAGWLEHVSAFSATQLDEYTERFHCMLCMKFARAVIAALPCVHSVAVCSAACVLCAIC